MNKLLKILIFLLPVLISFFLFQIFYKSYSGTVVINRSGGSLTIYRDDYGIPHIQADKFSDALYGLGRVHAQDRLWSMHLKRMLFSGRLSELFGSRAINIDKYMRTLGFRKIAEENVEFLHHGVKDFLQSYVDGINDYVSSLNILQFEFLATQAGFRYLEPFKIEDCLTFFKFLGFRLSNDWGYELLRADLMAIFDKDFVDEITPHRSDKLYFKSVILNDEDAKETGMYEEYKPSSSNTFHPGSNPAGKNITKDEDSQIDNGIIKGIADMLDSFSDGRGSNSWVIGGQHTESGKPILSNDPHLENNMPSIWQQVEIICGDRNIIGASLPGMPLIAIGKTKYLSFGITTLYGDNSDLYNETISDDGLKYYYEGEWYNLTIRKEIIKVRGEGKPIEYEVRSTRHGPILDVVLDKMLAHRSGPRLGQANYSLAWTGYIKNDTSLYGIYKLLDSKSPEELYKYLDYIILPSQNFIYAFEQGDFGYISMGKLPIHKTMENGGYVKDGTKAENDWLGLYPAKENPQILNPKKGYIITANNRITTDNYKHHLSINTATSARADRIEEMIREKLQKGEKFNAEHMKMMQLDIVDIMTRDTLPILIDLIGSHKQKYIQNIMEYRQNTKASKSEYFDSHLNELRKWNGIMDANSKAALIYTAWEYLFIIKTMQIYPLNEDVRNALYSYYHYDQFLYKNIHKWHSDPKKSNLGEQWCQTSETLNTKFQEEACIYNLVSAFYEVDEFLLNKLGESNRSNWVYGMLHKSFYSHMPFSQTALKPLYHREFPASGNKRTLNLNAFYHGTHQFDGVHSGNLRMIADMNPNGQSYYIIDTGVSEDFWSVHYDDQQKLHKDGKYLEMNMGIEHLAKYKDITNIIMKD